MMKKIFAFILSFSLIIGSTLNVAASEVFNDGEVSVPVSYDVMSTYTINMPASINFTGGQTYTFTAQQVNILDGQCVCIYAPEDGVRMTNEYGNSETLMLRNSENQSSTVGYFTRGKLTSEGAMMGQLDAIGAGHYEGTAVFTVRLEAKSVQ